MERSGLVSLLTKPFKISANFAPFRRRGRGLKRGGALFAAVVMAAIMSLGLFYVWTRMKVIQIGYEIADLEKKNTGLKNRKRELLVEMSSLQSPSELEKRARHKSGLIFPPMGKVVHVP
jgi:cell division protein FtsL